MFRFTQSDATAARRNVVFYAASTTDGYTAVTSGITSPTITIYKNGTGTAVVPSSPSVTHLTNGLWSYQLAQSDIDTTGMLSISIAHASIRTVHLVGYVYSGDAFNAPTTTQTGYLDAAITSRMGSYTQPTGFLTATFPSGTIANTTNITAGTIQTVSGNVNGNVSGSVNSVATGVTLAGVVHTGATIPTVTSVTNGVTLANAAITSSAISTGAIGDDVFTRTIGSYVGTSTYGYRLLRSDSTTHSGDVQVTGNGSSNNHNRIDSDVHAIATDTTAATNLKNALNGTGGVTISATLDALSTTERNAVSDALLNRNVAGGSSTGRLVKEALYALRNKTSISSTTLQVWNNDDSAIVWSASLSSDAAAIPITGIDPT